MSGYTQAWTYKIFDDFFRVIIETGEKVLLTKPNT